MKSFNRQNTQDVKRAKKQSKQLRNLKKMKLQNDVVEDNVQQEADFIKFSDNWLTYEGDYL